MNYTGPVTYTDSTEGRRRAQQRGRRLTLPAPPEATFWLADGAAHIAVDGTARELSLAELRDLAAWAVNAADAIGDAL